ncbi:MAG TPA: MbtH family protein [Pseudonocardiaceae bacterium]|jgi:MbtH protein
MTNPFDDPDATYLALVNEEGQYSLWPAFLRVPPGWEISRAVADRQTCLDHIAERWTDMRPRSLAARMDADAR